MKKMPSITRPTRTRLVDTTTPLSMPTQFMGFNIVRLAHLKRIRDDALFKADIGIGLNQIGLLLLLNDCPGASAGQLARVLLITAQSLGPLLSQLHTLGLVSKARERRRGMRIQVHMTKKGRRVLNRGQRLLQRSEEEARSELSVKEAAILNRLLIRVAEGYTNLGKS